MVTHSTPYPLVWMVFGPMLSCASVFLCLFVMWFSFDIGKSPTPTKKCKVLIESSPYLLVWMHFDHMLSYVAILPYLFVMFVLPSCGAMVGPSSPCPFILMYSIVVLYYASIWVCLGANKFGCVIILACRCVNMQMLLVFPMQQCPTVLERQL